MTSFILNITVDCLDPPRVAAFWGEVLGQSVTDSGFGDGSWLVAPESGLPRMVFNRVPDPTEGKNRLHLDVVPQTTRRAEVERLLDLGATRLYDHDSTDGPSWSVLADPEGNAFCVESGRDD